LQYVLEQALCLQEVLLTKVIGTHFEHALEQNDIVTKLLCEPYALCLQLHVPFKQVDELVQFEGLYTKAQLTDPEGPLLTQRIASRLVQQLRKHPLGWTSFDSFRVGNRQLHHEMLEDLGIEETLWMDQIRRIASMQEEDDHFFVSKLEFFDDRQVALVSDVAKEETIVRVLSQLQTEKKQYQVDETLLAKHIHNNFTMQGRQLDDDQKAALYLLLENQVAVLCGPGGSGKTTIIKTVLDYLIDERKAEIKLKGGHDLVVEAVAPTGKAAVNLSKSINMPCSTCHKTVFGQNSKNKFDDTEDDSEQKAPIIRDGVVQQAKPKQHQVDVLVIDEISMLDILVAGHLLAMIEKTASNSGSNYKQRYFLLGDVNQLPVRFRTATLSEL
jgi:thymidine kinase